MWGFHNASFTPKKTRCHGFGFVYLHTVLAENRCMACAPRLASQSRPPEKHTAS